jgi:hypothetical protein
MLAISPLSGSFERLFSMFFASFIFTVPILLGCASISFVRQVYSRLHSSGEKSAARALSASEAFFLTFLIGALLLNLLLALGPIVPLGNFSIFLYGTLSLSMVINMLFPFEVELVVTKWLIGDLIIMGGIALFSTGILMSKVDAALQFPLSFGYAPPYVFTARTLMDTSPLYFNSVAYLLHLHALLGVTVALTLTNPYGIVASWPFYCIPMYACSMYVVSRYFGVSRFVSVLIASMSIFVVSSAMGTLLYFSERTLLLALAPVFLLYTLKITRRQPGKAVLNNTLVAVFVMLVHSFLDPLTKLFFLLFSVPLISFMILSRGGIFECFDFLAILSFASLHIWEALPYILIRVLLYLRARGSISRSNISKGLKNIANGSRIAVLLIISAISFAPLFGLWPLVDLLSLDFGRLNVLPSLLPPYGFHNAFDAWQNWIIYSVGYWNYYVLLMLLPLYLLFARSIKKSVFLVFPSLLLVAVLTLRTSEIFRYLDALGMFYLVALITAIAHVEGTHRLDFGRPTVKIKIPFLTRAPKIDVNVKKVILSVLTIILVTNSILYGLQRYSDYIYVCTYINPQMTYEDLALADYLNIHFPSYRKYPLLPNGTNQQPLEYRGPLVISDPLTMATLYFSTASEVFMSQRVSAPFVEGRFSVEFMAELEQLKHYVLSNDVESLLHSIDEYRRSSSFNYSAVLLALTPRVILWLESSNEFITSAYDSESLLGQLNTLVAKFLVNQRLSLVQKINQDVFVIRLEN